MVTHGINRIYKTPPYLLVTFREVPLLIVLPGDVANKLYAPESIFVRFIRHVKILITIFAARSTVRLVVWRIIPGSGLLCFMGSSPFCKARLLPRR